MNGEQIYLRNYLAAQQSQPGSDAWIYAQTLRTALSVVGGEELYPMLEEAKRTGQQIDLTYPIPMEVGPSEPNGVRLVTFA